MTWGVGVVLVVWGVGAALWGQAGGDEVDFSTVDVRKLATHVYGTVPCTGIFRWRSSGFPGLKRIPDMPLSLPIRFQTWENALGFVGTHKYANITPEECYKKMRICSVHFAAGSIVMNHINNTNHLLKNAVPLLNLLGNINEASENELFLLENRYRDQTPYNFEDFFWTGSGDDSDDEEAHWTSDKPSTVYKTKTVVTTVFIDSPRTTYNETSDESTMSKCQQDCQTTATAPDEEIHPTKTFRTDPTTAVDDYPDADQQFWLVTILRSDGKDPVIIDLKNSLAKLYKIAFQRQQERHLGITNDVRLKRASDDAMVNVFIHDLKKNRSNGDEDMEVIYHVSVDGKPVPAVTAANDMTLVTDVEVKRALGYPTILTKAEPYMKPSEPQSLSSAKNTWIFIGVSISALLVCLLVLAFLILGCTKKKKQAATPATGLGMENRQHIFERGVGHENKGFPAEERKGSPTYINYKNENSTLSRSVLATSRPGSSISSSSTSLDISPLMAIKKHQRTPPKKPLRSRAALNKTVPMNVRRYPRELFDSDGSSSSRKESPLDDTRTLGNYDPGVVSPKSYLSMPSVKSFPRGSMPEPLNKVLEPVSVHHLDAPDDDPLQRSRNDEEYKSGLARHGSLGTVEDPGVIGPIVWNMHCQRLQHGVSVDEGMNDMSGPTNITKMRKRFHDLLDDTFSLFGSTKGSPGPEQSHSIPIEVKSHSAANTRSSDDLKAPTPKPRPKTSDLRKIDRQIASGAPKGAWSSKAPSPLVRPLSAGIINPKPRINVDQVLAEGRFRENDPAVPLIAAIRSEIERVSLPGSTHNLNG